MRRVDYRERIKQEYLRRKERNSSYSIRAFARHLRISHPTLLGLLKAERNLSKASLKQVAETLRWSAQEIAASEAEILQGNRASNGPPQGKRKLVGSECYPMLSEWYILPALYLSELEDNWATPEWIRSKLRITRREAVHALKILQELNLIRVESGRMIPNQEGVCFFERNRSRQLHHHSLQVHSLSRKWMEKADEVDQIQYFGTLALDEDGFNRLARRINQLKNRTDQDARKRSQKKVYLMVTHVFPAAKSR